MLLPTYAGYVCMQAADKLQSWDSSWGKDMDHTIPVAEKSRHSAVVFRNRGTVELLVGPCNIRLMLVVLNDRL